MSDKRLTDETTKPPKTVGVVIARFQVPMLHEGHRFIIDYVRERNETVLVILGTSGGQPTQHDPLDFETRRMMIKQYDHSAVVLGVRDVPSDEIWSQRVDSAIDELLIQSDYRVTLYGGPDSFIPHYLGRHPVERVEVPTSESGTAMRARFTPPGYPNLGGISALPFREGMVFAANIRKPVSYQTVDIAIIKEWSNPEYVLLGQHEGDDGLRFPGGFVDPSDLSLEQAARREAYEETGGMGLDGFEYLDSFRINDWRYRNAPDKIMTALFVAYYQFGGVPDRSSDDLDAPRWVPLDDLSKLVATVHRPLAERVLRFLPETMRKIAQHREEQRVR